MSGYLLISSRDPYECGDTESFYRLAADLKAKGRDVTLFLVQNGVLPAREGAENAGLRKALGAGVKVLADDFSLRERALSAGSLVSGIKAAPLDNVVDALAAGAKTFWH